MRIAVPGKLLICVVLLFAGIAVQAQVHKRDTLDIYKKIRQLSYKHKITKFLYQAVFVDPAPIKYEIKPLSREQRIQIGNYIYNGKIIRKIIVEVYDPFGYSVNDTLEREIGMPQQIANGLHITTRAFIIKNLVLFRERDTVDMFKINESERLLRTMDYITDARIYVIGRAVSDSVDVRIVVQDKWRTNARFVITPVSGRLSVSDQNLAGLGQGFEQSITYYPTTGEYKLDGRYHINNINRTYVSGELFYTTSQDGNQYGFVFNRPFYSAITRWAGGVSAVQNKGYYLYRPPSSAVETRYNLNYYNYDIWGAYSFGMPFARLKKRYDNLIVSLRHGSTQFERRPPFTVDTNKLNTNSKLYLGAIGFSVRKYYKDQYIYRFGANEDIPEGWLTQWVYGVVTNETRGVRYYTGIEVSRGSHITDFGYLSGHVGLGTLVNKDMRYNSTLNTGFLYFTDLFPNRHWYFRQFVTYKLIYGFNKEPYERINFNAGELYGFSSSLSGTAKMVLNLETVMYAPYNFIGFKFAPVLLIGLGMIDTDHGNFRTSPFYQAYATGFLIRNENFITSSFQVTFGIYPNRLEGTVNLFRLNPFLNFTLRVRNFVIGKPEFVAFE